MHVILAGATGLIGSATLHAMMGMSEISQISILSRRPVPMLQGLDDSRINVIIHKDFNTYDDSLFDRLRGAKGCVWALGVSQNDVDKDTYVHITKSLPLKAAHAFERLAPEAENFHFVLVSGEGATRQPGFATPLFGRVKGETENALMEISKDNPQFRSIAVRPSFIDYAAHDEIKQWIPPQRGLRHFTYAMLGPFIRNIWTDHHSPTKPLGTVLAQLAIGKPNDDLKGEGIERTGSFVTISNVGFRSLAGLEETKK